MEAEILAELQSVKLSIIIMAVMFSLLFAGWTFYHALVCGKKKSNHSEDREDI